MGAELVYVLVPYSIGPAKVAEHARHLLAPHAFTDDRRHGWYEYLAELGPVFDDPIAEGGLPDQVKRSLHGHVCDMSRLPTEPRPDALVTPDGMWHSSGVNVFDYWPDRDKPSPEPDFQKDTAVALESWPKRYADLLTTQPYCWVVAIWVHL